MAVNVQGLRTAVVDDHLETCAWRQRIDAGNHFPFAFFERAVHSHARRAVDDKNNALDFPGRAKQSEPTTLGIGTALAFESAEIGPAGIRPLAGSRAPGERGIVLGLGFGL